MLVVVAAVVAGGLFIAALPDPDDPGSVALASATPRATRAPSPKPTARPRRPPTPDPTPAPPSATPKPNPTPSPPPARCANLCEPFFGIACGLDKGTYAPAAFSPAIQFKLGDGWAVRPPTPDLVSLTRDTGRPHLRRLDRHRLPERRRRARADVGPRLVETFIGTDGVAAGKPKNQKVDKRAGGRSSTSPPTGRDRIALFGTGDQTFFLEAGGTTRIYRRRRGRRARSIIAIEPDRRFDHRGRPSRPPAPSSRAVRFR